MSTEPPQGAKEHVRALAGLLLLLLFTINARGQTPPTPQSVEKQFSAYHLAVTSEADRLLASPTTPAPVKVATPAEPPIPAPSRSSRAALARIQPLRPLLEPILREQGLPEDLTAVALVESGGRPAALSPKGARGLWQLMPETARRYGLIVTPAEDERLDALKATRAAARYLRDLYARFGAWDLALAAYNAGEQTVGRALQQSGGNFVRLSALLPVETRNYVPAVLAAQSLFRGVPATVINTSAVPTGPGWGTPQRVFAQAEFGTEQ